MSEELFYDYHCSSCKATYTSNEPEDKCFYCSSTNLSIKVQRPKIQRIRKKSELELLNETLDNIAQPDWDWINEVNNNR
jgi:DNA-directed RNA polymerase subunit RPC12/RpoP